MTTSEIVTLVEKFTCKTYPNLARPIYRGEYAYATDGRICIRARMPGGKFEGGGSVATLSLASVPVLVGVFFHAPGERREPDSGI